MSARRSSWGRRINTQSRSRSSLNRSREERALNRSRDADTNRRESGVSRRAGGGARARSRGTGRASRGRGRTSRGGTRQLEQEAEERAQSTSDDSEDTSPEELQSSQNADISSDVQAQLENRRRHLSSIQRRSNEIKAQQEAKKKTATMNSIRRTLQAFRIQSEMISAAVELAEEEEDEDFEAAIDSITRDEVASSATLGGLEEQLAAAGAREQQLGDQLADLLPQLPPCDRVSPHIMRLLHNDQVRSAYEDLADDHVMLTRMYNMTELMMLGTHFDWHGSRRWMERVLPRFHRLHSPVHALSGAQGDDLASVADDMTLTDESFRSEL